MCQMSWKSGSLNLLGPSRPHWACYGTTNCLCSQHNTVLQATSPWATGSVGWTSSNSNKNVRIVSLLSVSNNSVPPPREKLGHPICEYDYSVTLLLFRHFFSYLFNVPGFHLPTTYFRNSGLLWLYTVSTRKYPSMFMTNTDKTILWFILYSLTLKMRVQWSFEMSPTICHSRQHNVQKNLNLQ